MRFVPRNHCYKGAVASVSRGIIGSDQCLVRDDVALRCGWIDKDEVTKAVSRPIPIARDADLTWAVTCALDRVSRVDVVIHQTFPRTPMRIAGSEPVFLVV